MLWAWVGGFILLAWIDLWPMIRKKQARGIASFLVLWTAALTLAVLEAFDVQVPSVILAFEGIVRMVGLGYPEP